MPASFAARKPIAYQCQITEPQNGVLVSKTTWEEEEGRRRRADSMEDEIRTGIHGAAPMLDLGQMTRLDQHGVMCFTVSPNGSFSSGSTVLTFSAVRGLLSAQLSASQTPLRM